MRSDCVRTLSIVFALAFAVSAIAQPEVVQTVHFSAYSPLSRSVELAQRLLTPLAFQRLQQYLADKGQTMREQSVDLAKETFAVYVPAGAPPKQGYGLLAFVSPWSQATLPHGWAQELDRRRLIFVSAANSGNSANVIDRRVPLALLAWENIRRQYRLDPDRVYVGGFSGGSRVALRIALTYPDVFRGALLEAGSDPIGEPPNSLPPADLFHRFQTSSRLVYLTGGQDAAHLQMDAASRQSLQYWCVFDVATVPMPWLGHELAEPAALGRALDALTQSATVDANRLTQCRAHNETAMTAALAEAETALAHGDRARARSQIATIDTRYAGLATATLLKLEAQLDTKP